MTSRRLREEETRNTASKDRALLQPRGDKRTKESISGSNARRKHRDYVDYSRVIPPIAQSFYYFVFHRVSRWCFEEHPQPTALVIVSKLIPIQQSQAAPPRKDPRTDEESRRRCETIGSAQLHQRHPAHVKGFWQRVLAPDCHAQDLPLVGQKPRGVRFESTREQDNEEAPIPASEFTVLTIKRRRCGRRDRGLR
ncbi:hypothetical protein KM043_006607 [Ampulex compressa]|nr:hypothetical protein KM043_006607 [Ampulex compressa]